MAFYLHRDGKSVEFPIQTLREMARLGELRQDEYIYDDGKREWIGAALVPEMEGAWNIEENEATVAMELPPEFFAEAEVALSAADKELPATEMAPAMQAPEPEPMRMPEPEPMRMPEPEPMRTPRAQSAPQRPASGGRGGRMPQHGEWISPIKVLILMLVTCGIYGLFWLYKRMGEINVFLEREEIKPLFFFLGFLCGPLFIVILWKMSQALPEMGKKIGAQIEDRAVMLLILALCFPYGFYYLVQQDLNTIWEKAGATPAS